MKTKKLLSLALCVGILFSCLFFTDEATIAFGEENTVYESSEPVTPPESDFTYERVSDDDADGAIISAYNGNETKIIIPETLDGLVVTEIYYDVFSGNEKLTYIKLPSGLTTFTGDTFKLCTSLEHIDVADGNPIFTSVDGVLYSKDMDEDSATFGKPDTLSCFPAGRSGSFTVPYGIKIIDSNAFAWCYGLTEVRMYNTVTTINSGAFTHCWNLESIRLSSNLKSIRREAFSYCDSLRYIDLPSGITSIGTDAFLGGIDSDDNKFYYFTDGIACVENSYAYNYIIKQRLPESIIIPQNPSITDNDTGISLIDAYSILPENEVLDITVNEASLNEVESLLPTRYSSAYAFDISFTNSGEEYTPDGSFILNFDSVCSDAVPSAVKVYQQIGNRLILVSGSANTPFICAKVNEGGRFVILINNDFSLKGDIDGDGIITLFDAKAALYASTNTLSLTDEQKIAADADNSGDGKITTEDARKILRLAGGMSIE